MDLTGQTAAELAGNYKRRGRDVSSFDYLGTVQGVVFMNY